MYIMRYHKTLDYMQTNNREIMLYFDSKSRINILKSYWIKLCLSTRIIFEGENLQWRGGSKSFSTILTYLRHQLLSEAKRQFYAKAQQTSLN